MLRQRKSASERDEFRLDETDERLLAAIDAQLPWQELLKAARCSPEEAQARLMRMFHLGLLEDDTAKTSEGASDEEEFEGRPTGLLDLREPPQSGVQAAIPSVPVHRERAAPTASLKPSQPATLSDAQRAVLEEADVLVLRLGSLNHYERLGVSPKAAPDEIKRAYSKLARRFHPDAFFRKPIGDSRAKLEHIFSALTAAYDVLRNPEQRAAYDASLGLVPKPTQAPTRVVATFARSDAPLRGQPIKPSSVHIVTTATEAPRNSVRAPAQQGASAPLRVSEAPRASVRAPESPVTVPPRASLRPENAPHSPRVHVHTTPPSAANQRSTPPQKPAPVAPPRSSASEANVGRPLPAGSHTESLLRDLRMRRLQSLHQGTRGVSTAPSTPNDERTRTSSGSPSQSPFEALAGKLAASGDTAARKAAAGLMQVRELEQRGDLASALSVLQLVVSGYPDLRLRELRDRLKERVQKESLREHRELAIGAQNKNDHRTAAEHWRKVAEADRHDAKAQLQAALCYLQAREIKQAGPFAQRAVELAPNDVLARRALLRFYEAMGMERNAARERQMLEKLRGT